MNTRTTHKQKKAVSPVLATLLMVAVAVALSVIVFIWSQGFLAASTGGASQQLERMTPPAVIGLTVDATFTPARRPDTTSIPAIAITVFNNRGSQITLLNVEVKGIAGNTGFKGSLRYTWTSTPSTDVTETSGIWTIDTAHNQTSLVQINDGASTTFTLTESGNSLKPSDDTYLSSGDYITIKITTTDGLVVQRTFVV